MDFKDIKDRLEPEAHAIHRALLAADVAVPEEMTRVFLYSQAISLKRIADALQPQIVMLGKINEKDVELLRRPAKVVRHEEGEQ